MYTRLIIFVGLILLMGGCISQGEIKPGEMQTVSLLSSDSAPTEAQIAATGQPKVVLDEFREPKDQRVIEISSLANLASTLMATAEKYLTEAGIEVISRKEAKQLLDEVKLAEQTGKVGVGGYTGPLIARYVLVGRIDSVDTSATRLSSNKCKEEANVGGTIHIYMVPQLQIAKSVNMRGNATRYGGGNCQNNPANLTALIREAGEKAVGDARTKLQNFFAPKGYITEMRQDPTGKIFSIKVNIGSQLGLKKGNPVEVFSDKEQKITTGKITEQITKSDAWIILDDPEQAKHVKKGYYVKMTFEKGWEIGDKAKDLIDGLYDWTERLGL
jgi:hypothetical protein